MIRYIEMFGGVRVDGQLLVGEKVAGLLVYLALDPSLIHTREMVADTLWPALPPGRARRALSDTLYRLRLRLDPHCLIATTTHISLNPAVARTDAGLFQKLVGMADADSLRRAAELYAGPLAPELYDDWLAPRRVAFHERYLDILVRLGDLAEGDSQFHLALGFFQRLVEAEPLREEGYRGMMRVLARLGRPAEALECLARLEALLRAELGIEPAPATRALATAIRAELEVAQSRPDPARPLPFIGRAGERAAALERVEAMLAGWGGVLAVEGQVGMGKSRLWEEIAAGARWRGAGTLAVRVNEYPTVSPLDPLRELISHALRGPRSSQIEIMLPDETVAALGDLYPPWRGRVALPELPLPQARLRLVRNLSALFRALTDLSPLVLILDDMQWATPDLWEVVAGILDDLSPARLLIGLAYQRPDIEQSAGWAVLQRWQRAGTLSVISLGPLLPDEITAALPQITREQASAMVAVSGGNPFYLAQTMLVGPGYDIPQQMDRIMPDRLKILSPPQRRLLAEASVFGMVVPFRLWLAVSGVEPETLIEAGDRLIAHQFMTPIAGGYTFSHDLIHTVAYNLLDPDQRRVLHASAALAVAEFEPDNVRSQAFHLDRSDQPDPAAGAYRAAGALDLATFSFAEARVSFERALALWPDSPSIERIETLFDNAGICDSTGDRDRQRSALDEAWQLAHRLENDALVMRAHLGLGRLAAVTGQVDDAAHHLGTALDLAGVVADGDLRFEAHFYSGDLAARRGRLDLAREQFQAALDTARAQSEALQEARALRGLSIVARLNGDPAGALTLIDQALALQQAGGDLFGASVSQSNQLAALYDLGAWDRLLSLAAGALALKEKLGDRHGAAIMRYMRGLAALSLGNPAQARELVETAERELLAASDRRTAGLARNVLGLINDSEGRLDDARRDFEAAIAVAVDTGATTESAYARHDLGALLVRQGAHRDAIPLLESARSTFHEQGNELLRLKSEAWLGLASLATAPERATALAARGWTAYQQGIPPGEAPQAWLWALYKLLVALRRQPQAKVVLRSACDELYHQAAAIQDLAQCKRFLEQVPLNRDIIAAWALLSGGTQVETRLLARIDAPAGRLAAADRIPVTWTLTSPDDSRFEKPAQRRHHVLLRLLAEAAEQGAAPTDDDLAAALGVSRRTILRDMQALERAGYSPVTRRRRE